jgi:hypothetical protein
MRVIVSPVIGACARAEGSSHRCRSTRRAPCGAASSRRTGSFYQREACSRQHLSGWPLRASASRPHRGMMRFDLRSTRPCRPHSASGSVRLLWCPLSPTAFHTRGTRNWRASNVMRRVTPTAASRSSDREAAPSAITRRRHRRVVRPATVLRSIPLPYLPRLPSRFPDTHRDPGPWSFATHCMSTNERASTVTRLRLRSHPLRRKQRAGIAMKIITQPAGIAHRVMPSSSPGRFTRRSRLLISAVTHVIRRQPSQS